MWMTFLATFLALQFDAVGWLTSAS